MTTEKIQEVFFSSSDKKDIKKYISELPKEQEIVVSSTSTIMSKYRKYWVRDKWLGLFEEKKEYSGQAQFFTF